MTRKIIVLLLSLLLTLTVFAGCSKDKKESVSTDTQVEQQDGAATDADGEEVVEGETGGEEADFED